MNPEGKARVRPIYPMGKSLTVLLREARLEALEEAAKVAENDIGVVGYGKNNRIAAALNAWPGMHIHEWQRPWLGGMSGTDLILPLTEASDE